METVGDMQNFFIINTFRFFEIFRLFEILFRFIENYLILLTST